MCAKYRESEFATEAPTRLIIAHIRDKSEADETVHDVHTSKDLGCPHSYVIEEAYIISTNVHKNLGCPHSYVVEEAYISTNVHKTISI
jgi:hypothetical protein